MYLKESWEFLSGCDRRQARRAGNFLLMSLVCLFELVDDRRRCRFKTQTSHPHNCLNKSTAILNYEEKKYFFYNESL